LSKTQFHKDEVYMAAYNRGVSELGAMVRARMVDEALDNGNFQALMYLDKKFGGDDNPQELVITHRPLESADTNELLIAIQSCKPV
jgi:aromatic ring-opening dioxygenase LigB subunit